MLKKSFRQFSLSPAKTLKAFCVFFMVAAALASVGTPRPEIKTASFILGFFCLAGAVIYKNKKSIRLVLVLLAAVFLGCWRLSAAAPNCISVTNACHYLNQTVNVKGVISAEPAVRLKDMQYTLSNLVLNGQNVSTGQLLLAAQKYPKFYFGETIEFKCNLSGPGPNDPGSTFRYDKYLDSHGIQVLCRQVKEISVLKEPSKYNPMSWILKFKSFLNGRVESLWVEPEASLMTGILYGARSTLPQATQDEFSLAGVSHIVAVSGFNVSIIAVCLFTALTRLGIKRQRGVWLALVFIWLFVLFAGASAAAVRAGIMGSVVIAAERLGRLASPGVSLLYAATVMTALNPYILLWDVGFQLSFGATLGLVYGTEFFEPLVKKIPLIKKIPGVAQALATTLAANAATLPLLLYYFGRISVISVLANVLIVPLVPWLMLLGAVAASFIFMPIGFLFSALGHVGLWYILATVHLLGRPGQWVASLAISWWMVVVWYGILILYVQKNKTNELTDRV